MVSYNLGALVFLLSIIVLKIVRSSVNAYRRNRYMPPGPSGLPLLGNIFQVGDQQWVQFTEWKERYGKYCTKVNKDNGHIYFDIRFCLLLELCGTVHDCH